MICITLSVARNQGKNHLGPILFAGNEAEQVSVSTK